MQLISSCITYSARFNRQNPLVLSAQQSRNYVTQPLYRNNYERVKHLINLFHIKDSMRFDIYISCQLVPSSFPFFFNFLQIYFVRVCVAQVSADYFVFGSQ